VLQELEEFQWHRAKEGELFKLLGTPCGLHMDILDVEFFCLTKFFKNTFFNVAPNYLQQVRLS
jgi:hypothetical protein